MDGVLGRRDVAEDQPEDAEGRSTLRGREDPTALWSLPWAASTSARRTFGSSAAALVAACERYGVA
jgi:hypothetical protein